jgi:hypothetical protein
MGLQTLWRRSPPKTLITPALFSRPLPTPLTGRRGRTARRDGRVNKGDREQRFPSPREGVVRSVSKALTRLRDQRMITIIKMMKKIRGIEG